MRLTVRRGHLFLFNFSLPILFAMAVILSSQQARSQQPPILVRPAMPIIPMIPILPTVSPVRLVLRSVHYVAHYCQFIAIHDDVIAAKLDEAGFTIDKLGLDEVLSRVKAEAAEAERMHNEASNNNAIACQRWLDTFGPNGRTIPGLFELK